MTSAGARLVLVEFDDMTGAGELPFGISATREETLYLATTDTAVVDKVVFDGVDAVVSLCRVPDGAGNWQACDQTFPLSLLSQREFRPVSASSRASAKVDLPDPFRPAMTISPGPGCSGTVTFGPIPRNPCTEMDCR